MNATARRTGPRVGVLALQGAFHAHVVSLTACGARAVEVRDAVDLASVDALVIPGGESTVIRKMLDRTQMRDDLVERIRSGDLPVLGTCAGLIVLSETSSDGAPPALAVLDARVERNGYGSQVASFEAPVDLVGAGAVPGVFIRAPRITSVGPGVEVVGRLASGGTAGEPVAIRQGCILATTFHPELTDDTSVHRLLLDAIG